MSRDLAVVLFSRCVGDPQPVTAGSNDDDATAPNPKRLMLGYLLGA
jgi:hypothetical protein